MPDQDSYNKVFNIYNHLKNVYREPELATIRRFEKVMGSVLDTEVKAELLDQKRPALEYPLADPMRNAYIGTERSSRVNMRAIPKKNSTAQQAHWLTSAMYDGFNKTWYDWRKSKQFMSALVRGICFSESYWDFNKEHWVFKAIDPLRIRWDKTAQSLLLDDCRYLQDTNWLTREEIIALAPDRETKRELIYQFKFHEPMQSPIFYEKFYSGVSNWDTISSGTEDIDFSDFRNGRYRVVDHHEQRDEKMVLKFNTITEDIEKFEDDSDEAVDKFLDEAGEAWQVFEIPYRKFYQTIICPAVKQTVFEAPYEVETGFFSKIPMGMYDVMPELFDIQSPFENPLKIIESYSKRKSVELEYAIDTVGGEYIVEDEAIADYEEDWQTRAKKFVRRYRAGTQRPQREQPANVPATLFQYANEDLQILNIIGISPNYRGMKESANETGKLANTKIQQQEMMLQHIFDNVRLSQYMDSYSAIKHIQRYMTEETKIKLLGKEDYVVLNQETLEGRINTIGDGEFDIDIDTSRPSATARQSYLETMAGLLQYVPPNFVNFVKLFESTDLPFSYELANFARQVYKQMGIDPDNPENTQGNMLMKQGNMPQAQVKQQIQGVQ